MAEHVTRGTMTQSFRSRLNRNDIVDFRYGGDKAAGSAHTDLPTVGFATITRPFQSTTHYNDIATFRYGR